MVAVSRIVIVGGGPAGYEAALVAAQLGADVTLVDRDGTGGACVLTDCVPSKSLIATSDSLTSLRDADRLGIQAGGARVDLAAVNARIRALARQQSDDIRARLLREDVTVLPGAGRFAERQDGRRHRVEVVDDAGSVAETLEADVVLLATGGTPRVLPGAAPDGERILSWRDLYELKEMPEHLVVVGSGVTGAEFASGYSELGVPVTLVSSRDRVLPGEDPDAAAVIEQVFTGRGGTLVQPCPGAGGAPHRGRRARRAQRRADGGRLARADVRRVRPEQRRARTGARGRAPHGRGVRRGRPRLAHRGAGRLRRRGLHRRAAARLGGRHAGPHRDVARAGRRGAAAAAEDGRRDDLHPPRDRHRRGRLHRGRRRVGRHPAGVATAGGQPAGEDARPVATGSSSSTPARPPAPSIGAVVVAPEASELVYPLALAVQKGLTVDDLAATISVYPSLTGSLAEAGRRLMHARRSRLPDRPPSWRRRCPISPPPVRSAPAAPSRWPTSSPSTRRRSSARSATSRPGTSWSPSSTPSTASPACTRSTPSS